MPPVKLHHHPTSLFTTPRILLLNPIQHILHLLWQLLAEPLPIRSRARLARGGVSQDQSSQAGRSQVCKVRAHHAAPRTAEDVIPSLDLEVGQELAQLLVEDVHGPEVGEFGGGCGLGEVCGAAGAYLVVEDDWDRVCVCERPVIEEVVVAEPWPTVEDDEGRDGRGEVSKYTIPGVEWFLSGWPVKRCKTLVGAFNRGRHIVISNVASLR